MLRLTALEKVELGTIPVAMAFTGWVAPRTGLDLELGVLIAGGALLLLLQGFGRDLWLWRQTRRATATPSARTARCLCVESAIGLTGIVAGIGLTGLGLAQPLRVSAVALVLAVGGVMAAGFFLKDLVFEWSPWRIYREKNHAQVIFRWRT